MTWTRTATRHTCNDGFGPVFGRKAPGCPRCDELIAASTTAQHTCNGGRGPAWGRRTDGCPRCDQLADGAAPVELEGTRRRRLEEQQLREIAAHFASPQHLTGGCGPVCTFGDW